IRYWSVTGVQTCALPIWERTADRPVPVPARSAVRSRQAAGRRRGRGQLVREGAQGRRSRARDGGAGRLRRVRRRARVAVLQAARDRESGGEGKGRDTGVR